MIGGTADVTSVKPIQITKYAVTRDNMQHKQDQGAKQIMGNTPTEKTTDNGKTRSETELQAHGITRSTHVMEEGILVFKRYDEDGKLIQRVPPGYVPISEMV